MFGQIEENVESLLAVEAVGVVEEKAPVDGRDDEGEGDGARRQEPTNFDSLKVNFGWKFYGFVNEIDQ